MKKVFSLLLIVVLTLSMLAGCGQKTEPAANEPTPTAAVEQNAPAEEGKIVKLGLGHITSIKKSKDLGKDKEGKEVLPVGQVDTVIVAAGFDKDGKVVSVTIDNAQTKVNFDAALQLTSDKAAELKTKLELKDAYGMIKASKIGKEWYQQSEELAKWMVGKTVAEIKAMKVKKVDDAHPSVPDVPELASLVTITIQDYVAALEEAYNNAKEVKGGVKVGLGHNISIAKSKGLGKDKDGKEVLPVAQVDTVMAATAFDKDGKVVGTIIDNAQTKVAFDNTGKVTTDKNGEFKTKVELKDAYGMIKASKIGKEWYQQAEELGKWMVGKTIDEIKAMKVKKVDDNHPSVPDVPELTSLVTMDVGSYIKAVAEAFANAK
ncbi:MAG: lipoprotein [Bacillota bacterium]